MRPFKQRPESSVLVQKSVVVCKLLWLDRHELKFRRETQSASDELWVRDAKALALELLLARAKWQLESIGKDGHCEGR